MARANGIHWYVPTMMLGGLVAGTLLAVGHHLFYRSLNDQAVSNGAFLDSPVSKQQANIAIGTALAFLVKACLVFAVGLAFLQIFWSVAHARGMMKPPTVERLDSAYGALDNFWALFNIPLWWRYPMLLVIASIAWLVPIASIITPATLSIQSAPITPAHTALVHVPNIDFRSLSFLAHMQTNPSNTTCFTYNGPSEGVRRITNAVMAQGQILPFDTPASNASWRIEFFGPSLNCQHVAGSELDKIRRNFYDAGLMASFYYAAWFPNSHGGQFPNITKGEFSNQSHGLPFYETKGSDGVWGFPLFSEGFLVSTNNANLEFYMAVMPFNGQDPSMLANFTAIHCRLVNSTYEASFTFTDGTQDVAIKTSYIDDGQTLQSIHISCATIDYAGSVNKYRCPHSERTCFFNPRFFQSLSYQAVMDAVVRQISGQISLNQDGGWSTTTNIQDTVLIQTPDLSNIRVDQVRDGPAWAYSFQGVIVEQKWFDKVEFYGLETADKTTLAIDLPEAVEQLFQNVTVSLMTSPALQPNKSSITAPGPVNVTFHKYHNIYVYTSWKLWIPYGIGIGITILTALVGFITMLRMNRSYSDNFSTILRAARGAKLSEEVREGDMDGKDPLPKYLKNSKLWLPGFEEPARAVPMAAYKRIAPLDAPLDVALPRDRMGTDSGLRRSNMLDQNNSAASSPNIAAQSMPLIQPSGSDTRAIPRRPVASGASRNDLRAHVAVSSSSHSPHGASA